MQEKRQEKSLIKQRILEYLKKNNITMYACYSNTGMTRGILSQNNGISEDSLLKFLAYYTDVNLEWLLLGQGEMLLNKKVSSYKPADSNLSSSVLCDEQVIYKGSEDTLYKLYREKDDEVKKLYKRLGEQEEYIRQLKNQYKGN